ncbi:MAG: hypothetical protein AAF752_03000 [Bacteroidota bacterium]
MPFSRAAAYLWAGPNSLIGLIAAGLAIVTGGQTQVVEGVLEAHGGLVTWILRRLSPAGTQGSVLAMTLGHVVIGQSPGALSQTRAHERVHVRQYERWGPLFIPAYVAASLWMLLTARRPYLDNPFEVEAYRDG